jgi:hypothetical protein
MLVGLVDQVKSWAIGVVESQTSGSRAGLTVEIHAGLTW